MLEVIKMGKMLLDKIVVIDVEATCWERKPPPGEKSEIIEIGVCVLDLITGKRESRESILVKPEQSTISEYCTQLTTLTKDLIDSKGVSFSKACRYLRQKYKTRERPWASYGDYDRRQFERQCRDRGVPYPFGPKHLNVKLLFALLRGLRTEVGMAESLKMMNIPLEGTHHRGVDDAWNIAGILSILLGKSP